MLKSCEETSETLKEPVYVRDVHNSKEVYATLLILQRRIN